MICRSNEGQEGEVGSVGIEDVIKEEGSKGRTTVGSNHDRVDELSETGALVAELSA